MPVIGRQVTVAGDSGYGDLDPNEARASIMSPPQADGWITDINIHAGRTTGATAYLKLGAYKATSTSLVAGALIVKTASFPVSALMLDQVSGAIYTRQVTGAPVDAGQYVGLAVLCLTAPAMHGQDNSGHRIMYDDATSDLTDPYDVDRNEAQGKISIWANIQNNRAPNAPSISPASNSTTVDTTPTFTFTHTDSDTVHGDYLKSYRVEVWNEAGTTRLQNTGVITTGIVGNVATWTPTALTAGLKYRVRVWTYDHHDLASAMGESTITINSGGAFGGVTIVQYETINDPSGRRVLDSTVQPTIRATWSHDTAASTQSISVVLRRTDTSAIVRSARTLTRTVASGATTDIVWADGTPAWADLARDNVPLRVEITAIDALGGSSATSYSETFVVNPRPVLTWVSPTPKTIASGEDLIWSATDANDAPERLSFVLDVNRPNGGPSIALQNVSNYGARYLGSNQWALNIGQFLTSGLGTYYFSVYAFDPYGEIVGAIGGERVRTLVAPPALTAVSPADESVVTNGTPTISYTLDRTQARRRITISNATGFSHSTDWVTTASTSYAVPAATLRNNQAYDLLIEVETADGLTTSSLTQFAVVYPADPAIAGATIAAVQSSRFDTASITVRAQLPNVRATWSRVSEATVSTTDWIRYILRRYDPQDRVVQWNIESRDQTTFTDTTPAHGVAYRWELTYEKYVNGGVDTIESTPVAVEITVALQHITITSESPDDPAVTLHWFEYDEDVETDVAKFDGWGRLPALFKGPKHARIFSGTFTAYDDDSGLGMYGASDVVSTVRTLMEPIVDELTGRRRPRALYWRDIDIDDAVRGSITSFRRRKSHDPSEQTFEITWTEHE